MTKKLFLLLLIIASFNANAVRLSDDGTGQALIFPYYTVNGGFNTLIHLTNTTDQAKALRIRFREAANSRETFAFNLYLGAHDIWVAGLVKSGEQDGFLAKLINPDASCTVPAFNNQVAFFNDDNFISSSSDPFGTDINRTYEGFIEVIEMGELTGASAAAVVLDENKVANCNLLQQAWDANSSNPYWIQDRKTDINPPKGGISGNVVLINVASGIGVTEPATVLKNFSDQILHYNSENESPALSDANPHSVVKSHNGTLTPFDWDTGYEAVSSVLMKDRLENEFVLSNSIGAQTDWIITMPTKQYFTDALYTNQSQPIKPFEGSEDTHYSCEALEYYLFDRESRAPDPELTGPPGGVPTPTPLELIPNLCYSTNNLHIINADENPSDNVGIFSSNFPGISNEPTSAIEALSLRTVKSPASLATPTNPATDTVYFDTGHASLLFNQSLTSETTGHSLMGLPIIGFSVQQYISNNVSEGIKANYAGLFEYKDEVSIETQQEDISAIQISNTHKGAVLLAPYYTVNNGMNTLISLVNTTDQTKAIKINFLEGKNNRSCFEMNLYLSGYDVWTSGLAPQTATSNFNIGLEGQQTAKMVSFDHSCTDPVMVNEIEFSNLAFSGQTADGLGDDLARCTEGHIEIINMGDISDPNVIDGVSLGQQLGYPYDCGVVNSDLSEESATNGQIDPPTGGLYASISLINVPQGIDLAYDATAINGISTVPMYSHNPESFYPNLASGNIRTTLIDTEDGIVETTWNSPIDAVTALFMQSQTSNDFVMEPSIGALTEWVNTYPTKQFYVDPQYSNSALALPPFNRGLEQEFGACNYHRFKAYNREQQLNTPLIPAIVPDPLPPNYSIFPQYCWAVNVSKVSTGTDNGDIFTSQLTPSDFDSDSLYTSVSNLPFTTGWMQLDHVTGVAIPGALVGTGPNGERHEIFGQPILGFTAQKYVSGTTNANGSRLLANYGLIKYNNFKREMQITPNQ